MIYNICFPFNIYSDLKLPTFMQGLLLQLVVELNVSKETILKLEGKILFCKLLHM